MRLRSWPCPAIPVGRSRRRGSGSPRYDSPVQDARTDRRTVLILGSSDVTFTDSGESGAFPFLMLQALRRRAPSVQWRVEHRLLYPTPRMCELAERHFDATSPQAVHLSLGANTLIERTVQFSIRRRYPWLYPLAAPLIARAKALGGGGAEGSSSSRGVVFRAPRSLARLVFGTATMLDPDAALAATEQTLAMLRPKGVPVSVRLAEGNVLQLDQRETSRPLTEAYNEGVRRVCEQYGFPAYRLSLELGERYGRTPDGLHADLPTRAYGAERACDHVLTQLGLESAAVEKRLPTA